MHRFSSRQWVPVSLDRVFAFFADPANLPRLMPPELATRIEGIHPPPVPGNPATAGTAIHIAFRPIPFLPLRLRWVALILEFVPDSHFLDEQRSGPFASFRHRHGFLAETRDGIAGTLVTDDIEFALPFGFLGRLAAPLVRLQLHLAFAARRRRLPALLAAG
jgi:ligand-binding SRPBCC domain-containing protein